MNPRWQQFKMFFLTAGLCVAARLMQVQAQVAGDERWDGRFAVAGVPANEGFPMALAFDGANTYIGGTFQSVGRTHANSLVRFDGQRVESLPDGPRLDPRFINIVAMEMFLGRLYVGGFFTNVAGVPAGGLGCWDGANWSVPSGPNGEVYALRADAGGLLVGGNFSLPGWTNPITLARWDGQQWNVLSFEPAPCTVGGSCRAGVGQIAVVGSDVYATRGNGYTMGASLFRSDVSNQWISVPLPDFSTAPQDLSIGVFHGQLVAGGNFPGGNVAVYDGTNWHPLGGGFDHPVESMAATERFVCVAYRTDSLSPPRSAISRWDGTNWMQLGSEPFVGDFVWPVILGPDDTVYAAGPMTAVGDQPVPGLARWTGQRWEPWLSGNYLGPAGAVGRVDCFVQHQGSVYAGGPFRAVGGLVTDGIARWTGAGWAEVGGGGTGLQPSWVRTLLSTGPMLYAGGNFTNMGASGAANLAAWNGTNWSGLGAGLDGPVSSLAWWQDSLYAGGGFSMAGGVRATNIARWTGASWEPLGLGCDDSVEALATWRDKLYAGGYFTRAGDRPASLIACWDGAAWQEVGGGLTGLDEAEVSALAANEDGLYVAGSFSVTVEPGILNLARWDGASWHAVGDPLPGVPSALGLRGRTVFVGGWMTNQAGVVFGGVYRLEGVNWIALGGGVSRFGLYADVYALLPTDDEVFVGGMFSRAGGKVSVGIARWIEHPGLHMDARLVAPGSSLSLGATGDPGLRFDLEASSDLSTWDKTGTSEDGQGQWSIGLQSGLRHFFRTVARP